VQAFALAGVFLFVVLSIAYATFYRPLGVEPGEVGFTYSETLERAAVGLVLLGLFWSLVMLIWLAAGLAIDVLFGGTRWAWSKKTDRAFGGWGIGRDLPRSASSYALIVILAILFALLPYRSSQHASSVLRGEPVDATEVFASDNPLGLRAVPARIDWLSETPDQANTSGDLLYLGEAGGVAVLFEPETDEVVRVPLSAAVIRLLPPDTEGSD
jgi:hypothetical protein